jgi:hypothetical protein
MYQTQFARGESLKARSTGRADDSNGFERLLQSRPGRRGPAGCNEKPDEQ